MRKSEHIFKCNINKEIHWFMMYDTTRWFVYLVWDLVFVSVNVSNAVDVNFV